MRVHIERTPDNGIVAYRGLDTEETIRELLKKDINKTSAGELERIVKDSRYAIGKTHVITKSNIPPKNNMLYVVQGSEKVYLTQDTKKKAITSEAYAAACAKYLRQSKVDQKDTFEEQLLDKLENEYECEVVVSGNDVAYVTEFGTFHKDALKVRLKTQEAKARLEKIKKSQKQPALV
jgi:hypothetical protein